MNKRIQELVKNFAENIKAKTGYDMTEYDPFLDEAEKFAELLIQDCAKAVEDSIWHLPRGYKAVDQAKFVKRHFGVE